MESGKGKKSNNKFKLTKLWHGYVHARCARVHKPRHDALQLNLMLDGLELRSSTEEQDFTTLATSPLAMRFDAIAVCIINGHWAKLRERCLRT